MAFSVNNVLLLSFESQAKGIKLYQVDCVSLRLGTALEFRRRPSWYDANAVQLIVRRRSYPPQEYLLGHLDRDAAAVVSPLIAQALFVCG